jgi:hypothetical protein
MVLSAVVGGIVINSGTSPSVSPPKVAMALPPPTSNPIAPSQLVASQLVSDAKDFTADTLAPDAAIAAADADIAKQYGRLSNDQATYQDNQFGTGCNAGDTAMYPACLSQEQQAAAAAQIDETAAQAALTTDTSQIEAADQQLEVAISTYLQRLSAIAWVTAAARLDASQLAQSLTDERNAVGEEAADLVNHRDTAEDNQAISAAVSDERTDLTNLATALGIPSPPTQPST